MEELTVKIREICFMLEEAYDVQDWNIVQECIEKLDELYDIAETSSGDYDLDME
jgi:hypothetical protein